MCLQYLPPEKLLDRNSKNLSDRIRVVTHDVIEAIDAWYEKKLLWALDHRRLVYWTILGVAVISFGLIKFIGTEFFPDQDEGQFSITVKLPVGTRAEETDKAIRKYRSNPAAEHS